MWSDMARGIPTLAHTRAGSTFDLELVSIFTVAFTLVTNQFWLA